MIGTRIKELRERIGISQSQLAKKLDVTRSSVNAWEMGLSAPTTQYVVAMSELFHVSADYLLGIEHSTTISLDRYNEQQIKLIYHLLDYFDSE